MDFAEIVKLIGGETATLALAVVALWMLDRTWKARIDEANRYAGALEKINEQVRQAIERNTEAWARMLERVEK